MKTHIQQLKKLGACQEAVTWADQHPDIETVWRECQRGDWMLWLAGKTSGEVGSPSRRKLVFVAAQCAREVLPIFERSQPDDDRVRKCIEACEAYSRGEIDIGALRVARAYAADAAYAAADAANQQTIAELVGALRMADHDRKTNHWRADTTEAIRNALERIK